MNDKTEKKKLFNGGHSKSYVGGEFFNFLEFFNIIIENK